MFESLLLFGTTRRDIILHTRLRREIPNEIGPGPTPQHLLRFQSLLRRYPSWVLRKPASGGYNCAGHVWASRRTAIYDRFEESVRSILKDDGYRSLGKQGQEKQGDVVVYWDGDRHENILHVGIVSELREGITPQSPKLPWILSKWDDTSGEVLHHYNQVPWNEADYVLEFWTDRP